jgi:hypothetical protein
LKGFLINIPVLFLILLIFSTSQAQIKRDSLYFVTGHYTNKSLSTTFNKQLRTYNLTNSFIYSQNLGNAFVGIDEEFNSTINKSATTNIKDAHYVSLIAQYDINENIKIGNLTNYNIYSDDRQLAINQASNLNNSFYGKIKPLESISLIPYAGMSQNKQVSENDRGLLYGAEAMVDGFKITDFIFNSNMKFQNEDISPRENKLRFFNLDIKNNLENNFTNTLSAHYSEMRKDFYFRADSNVAESYNVINNIQSRTETKYSIRDRIEFTSGRGLSFRIRGNVNWREIDRDTRYKIVDDISPGDFDTKIQETNLGFSTRARYVYGDFSGTARISFKEREESHSPKMVEGANEFFFEQKEEIENQKNNKSTQTTVSLSSDYNLTNRDRIHASIFHRKLQYDTPSPDNFDDRDELLTMFQLNYRRNFSPFFDFFLNFEGSINHIVYLFAERSSNNNIQRVLKLTSGGTYRGDKLSSTNTFEVSANYTVYDFEEINPNLNSFAFRQFAFRDSTRLKLSRDISLFAIGNIKLSEQGDFRWSNFTSKPSRYLQETYFEPKIFYKYQKLSLGVGIRYYSLSTYNFDENNNLNLASRYRSIGPLSEITLLMNSRLYIKIYGWYEFIKNESNQRKELTNLNIEVNWKI